MIGRLNHVAIAVPSLAGAAAQYRAHAGRGGVRAGAAARARRHRRVRDAAQHQDRAAGAAGRELADRRASWSAIRRAASITSATRWPTSSPRATSSRPPARACWATASPRSARTASRCCSCIPRTSTARWSSSSRPEAHERHRSPSPSTSSSGGRCCSPSCRSACARRARTARSCPARPRARRRAPRLLRVVLLTTVISALVFAALVGGGALRPRRPGAPGSVAAAPQIARPQNEKSKAVGLARDTSTILS